MDQVLHTYCQQQGLQSNSKIRHHKLSCQDPTCLLVDDRIIPIKEIHMRNVTQNALAVC